MDSSHVIEIWHLFHGYIDKKAVDQAAEKFVDLVADFGVSENELRDVLGEDKYLDDAIDQYLEIDEEYDNEIDEWEY